MQERKNEKPASRWSSTSFANIVRYQASGIYFARCRVAGKLIWRSLKTDRITVAKLRLDDLVKAERTKAEGVTAHARGKLTVQQCADTYMNRRKGDPSLKPMTVAYDQQCLDRIARTWPKLFTLDASRVSRADCRQWAEKFSESASPTSFNNTVATLRQLFAIAIEAGARYENPVAGIKRVPARPKQLTLPEPEKFLEFVTTIEASKVRSCYDAADLVRFLAFGGFRKGEAKNITWADLDFKRGEILVRGDAATGTKNWTHRRVPMIPEMRHLLERLRAERPADGPEARVMSAAECEGHMTIAAKKVGMHRITHHDLRHLFATKCIEAGVDIPTVSRWLGHKDGGALAMKVYGHLRDKHSQSMAAKVSFAQSESKADNIVPMPKENAV